MKKFIKNIGNASTTASLYGKSLGHNVNAALYSENDLLIVSLESNGTRVKGVVSKVFVGQELYDTWEESRGDLSLLLHGLRLFGCKTAFDA